MSLGKSLSPAVFQFPHGKTRKGQSCVAGGSEAAALQLQVKQGRWVVRVSHWVGDPW